MLTPRGKGIAYRGLPIQFHQQRDSDENPAAARINEHGIPRRCVSGFN
jgi:hypothetical protein